MKSHPGCVPAPVIGPIQSPFFTNRKYYPVCIPRLSHASQLVITTVELVWEKYKMVSDQATNVVVDNQAHLTPLLAKYPWMKLVKDIDCQNLAS